METDFANIAGMFKASADLVKKTINEVSPERWVSQAKVMIQIT